MSDMLSEARLENSYLRLSLSVRDNAWRLDDKRAGVTWGTLADKGAWVSVVQKSASGMQHTPLALHFVQQEDDALRCQFVDSGRSQAPLCLVFRMASDAVQTYLVPDEGAAFPVIELFGRGLIAGAEEQGEAAPRPHGALASGTGEGPLRSEAGHIRL